MPTPGLLEFSFSLLLNAALLLSLVQLIDLASGRQRVHWLLQPTWATGLVAGLLAMLLIQVSTTLMPGIIFDTRSVLLAVCGLFLGPLPTAVAVALAAGLRAWIGGPAMGVGMAVVVASAGLGLAWRQALAGRPPDTLGWRPLLGLGLAVHAVMLGLMLFLPDGKGWPVIQRIGLPVLLICPAFTAALGMLLVERLRRQKDLDALQDREQRYHSLFENNHAVMLLIDPDSGAIVEANPAAAAYYGWPREQLTAMRISDINTLPAAAVRAEMAAAHGSQRRFFEFRHRRADGSVRDVEVFSGPVRLAGRSYLYSIVHDVSDRKAAEAALHAATQRLELALSAANQGIYDLDLRTGNAVVSPEYARMLGHDPATFRESNAAWLARLHPEDRARVDQVFHDCLAGRLPEYRVEFRQRRADGDWVWVQTVGKVVARDAQGRPLRLLGTHTDITERKRAEDELRSRNDELQRFNAAMVDREIDMIALKRDVNALRRELGREPLYRLRHFEADPAAPAGRGP